MIPDTTGLQSDEIRNSAGEIYMRRFYIRRTADGRSERYHEILLSDEQDLHDHPWDFTSEILHGSYVEVTPIGATEYSAGAKLTRKAQDPHRLALTATVWTHVTTGPYLRTWGFHTSKGWVKWRDYLGLPKRRWRNPSRHW